MKLTAVLLLSLFVLGACRNNKKKPSQTPETVHELLPEPRSWKEDVTYSIDSITDKPAVDSLFSRYKEEDLNVILAINRIDRKQVKQGTKLIIPDKIFASFYDYSTFPVQLKEADTISKLVLVSLRNQAFGIYENGYLIKCGPVSSGKKSAPTPAGKYHTNWKKKIKVSTIDPDWVMPWYFNIENKKGIAFHKYELPGYPASHACIRLREEDAIWIYNWGDKWILADEGRKILKNGSPVVIFGSYDFDAEPVWMKLVSDPKVMDLTENEKREIIELLKAKGSNTVEAAEAGTP